MQEPKDVAAAQAMDFYKGKRPGRGTRVAYDLIREKVSFMTDDRVMYPDIEAIREMIESNTILDAIESEIGPLHMARDMDLPQPNVRF